MQDRLGQRLGNYQLIRLLGRGGFAEVYLGEHCHLKTLAAIKILSTHLESGEEGNFLAEAQTLAINHAVFYLRLSLCPWLLAPFFVA